MSIDQFFRESGLKAIALAKLEACEASICLYLMNCSVSGLDQIITTAHELAAILKWEENKIEYSLQNLNSKGLLKIKYGDHNPLHSPHPSISISFQTDMSKWQGNTLKEVHAPDAIVYPFKKQNSNHLSIIENQLPNFNQESNLNIETWKRVLSAFTKQRQEDEEDSNLETWAEYAKELVNNHPVDQILLMIRHFGPRIPSLSLLGSSWQHYHNLYETETQKVDFLNARKKHQELDRELKECCQRWLDSAEEKKLSPDEVSVLKLLIGHRHPRRQLFWAYQLRSRYQNLLEFFDENSSKMLAVTSTGAVVKPQHPFTKT